MLRRCYHDCVHGRCVGEPDYTCACDLGWTGEACDVNCGCNNHSTCSRGVGVCDECVDWSEGEHCERCQAGSYGDATSEQGTYGSFSSYGRDLVCSKLFVCHRYV